MPCAGPTRDCFRLGRFAVLTSFFPPQYSRPVLGAPLRPCTKTPQEKKERCCSTCTKITSSRREEKKKDGSQRDAIPSAALAPERRHHNELPRLTCAQPPLPDLPTTHSRPTVESVPPLHHRLGACTNIVYEYWPSRPRAPRIPAGESVGVCMWVAGLRVCVSTRVSPNLIMRGAWTTGQTFIRAVVVVERVVADLPQQAHAMQQLQLVRVHPNPLAHGLWQRASRASFRLTRLDFS